MPKVFNDTQCFTIAGGFHFEQRDKAFTCTHPEKYENALFKSDYEEADSRVRFHSVKSEQRNDKEVVIQLADKLGHQSFIHINKLIKCLKSDPDLVQVTNDSVCSVIQFLFLVSGCDYISIFAVFGKISFLQTFFSVCYFHFS